MIANDYKNLTAESASSRYATVSSEEAFMSHTESTTGILKWGHREYIDSKQFAYGDVNIYVVPVVGDIDKDKITSVNTANDNWLAKIFVLCAGSFSSNIIKKIPKNSVKYH